MDYRAGMRFQEPEGAEDQPDLETRLHRQQVRQVLTTPDGFGYFVRLLSRLHAVGTVDATPEAVAMHNLGEELLTDIFAADHAQGVRLLAALREPEPSGVVQ